MQNEPAFPVEWKPVPDWPGYEVSNEGQVRSLIGPGFARKKRRFPRFKKAHIAKDGYARVSLSDKRNRRTETWLLHRLVASVFLGNGDGLDAAHLDGNKVNNHVTNLRWCTRQENESHKINHGTRAEGSRNGQSVLNEACIRAIRHLHEIDGFSQNEIAERFGVCQGTISAVMVGKTWGHVPQAK